MPLNVTILGLGPLGASLGLALGTLDHKTLDVGRPTITGWDSSRRVLGDARGRLAIDRAAASLEDAVRDADVVIAAVPYEELREVFAAIAPALKPGALVTDTAATKQQVLAWAAELLPATVEFVGGHPLVSFDAGDIKQASHDALRDAIYCLIPLARTRQAALRGVDALVSAVGAKPYYIDAAEHDSYIAAAAHLPVAVAVALMELLGGSGAWRELQPIAGEGLVGITELAAADPSSSRDALLSNAPALAGWLDRMIAALADLRSALDNPEELQGILERAEAARAGWLRAEPNQRPGEAAYYGNVKEVERPNLSGLFFGRRRHGADRNKRP